MNSRQRVLLAADHQKPDRLPMFRPNIIPMRIGFDEKVQHFFDTFEYIMWTGLAIVRRSRRLPGRRSHRGPSGGLLPRYQKMQRLAKLAVAFHLGQMSVIRIDSG